MLSSAGVRMDEQRRGEGRARRMRLMQAWWGDAAAVLLTN